jgi:hypothetical protein
MPAADRPAAGDVTDQTTAGGVTDQSAALCRQRLGTPKQLEQQLLAYCQLGQQKMYSKQVYG